MTMTTSVYRSYRVWMWTGQKLKWGFELQAAISVSQGRLPFDMEDFCIDLLAVPAFSAVEAGFRSKRCLQRHISQFDHQKPLSTARATTRQSERAPEHPPNGTIWGWSTWCIRAPNKADQNTTHGWRPGHWRTEQDTVTTLQNTDRDRPAPPGYPIKAGIGPGWPASRKLWCPGWGRLLHMAQVEIPVGQHGMLVGHKTGTKPNQTGR